jgi:hypothetical protein
MRSLVTQIAGIGQQKPTDNPPGGLAEKMPIKRGEKADTRHANIEVI